MKTKFNLLLVALLAVGSVSAQQANENQPDKITLVKRNKTAGITFIKDKIYQGDKIIGGMQVDQGTEKGQIVRTFTVFFTDGSKIAEAKSFGAKPHEWNITTVKDKHTHVITSPANNDAVDVIKYLIGANYL
ncbi:MAG TPA: hypothetical protein VK809_02735 [Bacteroidia bacterium]|jgi:hypothetical protein|nr:hypothetical protein [Bacteroidia bacterium]